MSVLEIIGLIVVVIGVAFIIWSIRDNKKRDSVQHNRAFNAVVDELNENRQLRVEIDRINQTIQKICKHDGDISFMQGFYFPQGMRGCNICGAAIEIYERYDDYCRDRDKYEISKHEKSITKLKENLAMIDKVTKGK